MNSAQNQIIGREKEKAIFGKLLQSHQAEFLVVYGRRRVGKTFAVRQYFQPNFVMEFSGANQAEIHVQLYHFHNEFKRYAGATAVKSKPKNWSEAFANLTDYLYAIKDKHQKMVVFIDELP